MHWSCHLALDHLIDGYGACFVVEPSSVELPAFQTVYVTVTAYADMWGLYTDQLICKVRTNSTSISNIVAASVILTVNMKQLVNNQSK